MKPWHAILVIASLNLLAYSNSLNNGFVGFDDNVLLDSNPAMLDKGALWAQLTATDMPQPGSVPMRGTPLPGMALPDDPAASSFWNNIVFVSRVFLRRKLRLISHALDFRLFGEDLWGHHLVNLCWHIAAACAAFWVGMAVLGSPWPALAAALFFSLHPVQTESVAYLAGRRDVLYSLFYLLGFYFWVRHAQGGGRRPLVFSGLCWLLGVASKEVALTLPVSVLAYEAAVGRLPELWKRRKKPLLVFAAAGLAAMIALAWPEIVHQSAGDPRRDAMLALGRNVLWHGGDAWGHWATVPRLLTHALGLVLWPATLSADYTYNAFPASASFVDPGMLLACAVLAGLGILAWRVSRKDKLLVFPLAWSAITYAPHLPVIPSIHNVQVFAEHWLYLSLFGPALFFGMIGKRWMERMPRGAAAAGLLVLSAFMWRTALRNRDWKDDLTLWSKTVETSPECARARHNLGYAYYVRGRVDKAVAEFKKAIQIDPLWFVPYYNLGQALIYAGDAESAMEAFQISYALNPMDGSALANIGTLLIAQGRLQEAERLFGWIYFRRTTSGVRLRNAVCMWLALKGEYLRARNCYSFLIRSNPWASMTHANLGALYMETGRPEDAAKSLERSVGLYPNDPVVQANLALAYGKLERLPRAMRTLEEARILGLERDAFHFYRGIILRDSGLWTASLKELEEAARLGQPAEAISQMGQTYAAMGRWRSAENAYRKSIAMKPSARDYYLLAVALNADGRLQEARSALRKALEISPGYGPAKTMSKSL